VVQGRTVVLCNTGWCLCDWKLVLPSMEHLGSCCFLLVGARETLGSWCFLLVGARETRESVLPSSGC
jgi:hypothetical protein